jgi:hypothetical protein
VDVHDEVDTYIQQFYAAACPPCGNGPFAIVNLDILCTELTNRPLCLLSAGAAGAASLPHAKVRRARFPAERAR